MRGQKLFASLLHPFTRQPRKQQTAHSKDEFLDARRRNLGADLPDLFAVVSWGCTATRWVGAVLNAHPQVMCLHALKEFRGLFSDQESRIDDVRYLKMLQILGAGYTLAGDIHGVDRSSVPRLKAEFGDRFQSAAIIRDPARRLLSQVSLFERFEYHEHAWTEMRYLQALPGFSRVATHYADRKKRYFMHAANLLNAVLEEQQHCRIFRTEDLTAHADTLCELVSHLSRGKLVASANWADEMIARPPINQHQSSKFKPTLTEGWQFEILRALVLPETHDAYQRHGYTIPAQWRAAQMAV